MSQRVVIRILVFIGILVLLNVFFALFGIHEHIDILGSLGLTLVLSIVMMMLFSRRLPKA
jgi:hypothetical protein